MSRPHRTQSAGAACCQHDARGNTTHLSDDAGNVVEAYLYDPYGTPTVYDAAGHVRPGGSAYDNRALFKSAGGYQWLPTAGLYYARARCYLPWHGRWLQPDPLGQAGGLNLYTYCANDPVNGIDPSGLEPGSIDWYGNHIKQSVGYGYDPGMHWIYQNTVTYPDGQKTDMYRGEQVAGGDRWGRGFSSYSGFGGSFGKVSGGGESENTRDFFAGIGAGAVKDVFNTMRFIEPYLPTTNPDGSPVTDILEGWAEDAGASLASAWGINPNSGAFQGGLPGGSWVMAAASLPLGGAEEKVAETGSRVVKRIAARFRFSTTKEAREAAELASPIGQAVKEADLHGPHFHPLDAKGKQTHDHYFFPWRFY